MTRIVMIAIPSRGERGISHPTARMILDAQMAAAAEDIGFLVPEIPGNPISAARNYALAVFLAAKQATDLFFIDDDVAAEGSAIMRLLNHDVDFVAGVYPHRIDGPSFPVQWHAHGKGFADAHMVTPAGATLLEVHGVPSGFMRVRRCVVERMVEANPDAWYHQPGSVWNNRSPDLFDFELRDHLKYSEDFGFCKKWRDIGGRIWIDPEIGFEHTGPKPFYGHLGDWLRGREYTRAETQAMKEAAD